jgi:hypothetical protein
MASIVVPASVPVNVQPVKGESSSVTIMEIGAPQTTPTPAPAPATIKKDAVKSKPGFRLAKIKMPDGTVKEIWRPIAPPVNAATTPKADQKDSSVPATQQHSKADKSSDSKAPNDAKQTEPANKPAESKSDSKKAAKADDGSKTKKDGPKSAPASKPKDDTPKGTEKAESPETPKSDAPKPATATAKDISPPKAPTTKVVGSSPTPKYLTPTQTPATQPAPAAKKSGAGTFFKALGAGIVAMDVEKALSNVDKLGNTLLKAEAIATGDTAALAELNKQTAAPAAPSKPAGTTPGSGVKAPAKGAVKAVAKPGGSDATTKTTTPNVQQAGNAQAVAQVSSAGPAVQFIALTSRATLSAIPTSAGQQVSQSPPNSNGSQVIVVDGTMTKDAVPASSSTQENTAPAATGPTSQPQVVILQSSAQGSPSQANAAGARVAASKAAPATTGQTVNVVQNNTTPAPRIQAPGATDSATPSTTVNTVQKSTAPAPQPKAPVTVPKATPTPTKTPQPTPTTTSKPQPPPATQRSTPPATVTPKAIGSLPGHPTSQPQQGTFGNAALALASGVGVAGAAAATDRLASTVQPPSKTSAPKAPVSKAPAPAPKRSTPQQVSRQVAPAPAPISISGPATHGGETSRDVNNSNGTEDHDSNDSHDLQNDRDIESSDAMYAAGGGAVAEVGGSMLHGDFDANGNGEGDEYESGEPDEYEPWMDEYMNSDEGQAGEMGGGGEIMNEQLGEGEDDLNGSEGEDGEVEDWEPWMDEHVVDENHPDENDAEEDFNEQELDNSPEVDDADLNNEQQDTEIQDDGEEPTEEWQPWMDEAVVGGDESGQEGDDADPNLDVQSQPDVETQDDTEETQQPDLGIQPEEPEDQEVEYEQADGFDSDNQEIESVGEQDFDRDY